ncbi:UNVERIFIED_CONTAM: hypothetical protein FKN15_076220 [Acipenser sinensis]
MQSAVTLVNNTGNSARDNNTGNSACDNNIGNRARDNNTGNSARDNNIGNRARDNNTGNRARDNNTGNSARDNNTGNRARDNNTGNSARDNKTGNRARDNNTGNRARVNNTGNSARDNNTGNRARDNNTKNRACDNNTGNRARDNNTGNSARDNNTGTALVIITLETALVIITLEKALVIITLEKALRSACIEIKESEKIFTELIRSIEKIHTEVIELIGANEKAAVNQAEGRMKKLEQEIAELRRRNTELKQLSETEDHIHFLQNFQSLCAPPEAGNLPSVTVNTDISFGAVRKAVSELKDHIEDFCKGELVKITTTAELAYDTHNLLLLQAASGVTLWHRQGERKCARGKGNAHKPERQQDVAMNKSPRIRIKK